MDWKGKIFKAGFYWGPLILWMGLILYLSTDSFSLRHEKVFISYFFLAKGGI